jgi:enterochelin esterase family protein
MKALSRCSTLVAIFVLLSSSRAQSQTKFISFDDFLAQHASAIFTHEKDSLFTLFWRQASQRGIPYIDTNNTSVTFLYRGRADSVKVYGDFTSWSFKLQMKQLPEKDLHYLRLSFQPDARLDYMLIVDNKEILDPLNKATAPSGYGNKSELAMPKFARAAELQDQPLAARGTLTTLTHTSTVLGYNHTVHVYLPASYDSEAKPYPVAYFQDGNDYLNFAGATKILDNMIHAKSLPPMIAVFVVPPTERERNRRSEYALNGAYTTFFVNELLPFIDKKYRTIRSPQARLVIGPSFGGMISLYIGFRYPDSIGNAASQSGYVSFANDSLYSLFRDTTRVPLRIYSDIGVYERSIGGIASPGGDFLAANRRLSRLLDQKKYVHEYREFNDGHSWARWRNELPHILRWFLTASPKP